MKSLTQWRTLQMFMEFNGPGGQPDPTGVSNPVLNPATAGGPSSPTMGTQPGMMYPKEEEDDGSDDFANEEEHQPSQFRQIYDDFIARLREKGPKKAKKIADIVQKDVAEILAQKGLNSNGEQDESGAPPLGQE